MNLEQASRRLAEIAGKPVRPFARINFGREENSDARSILVAEEDGGRILEHIRRELGPGLIAFIGYSREIVVAPGTSQFDILRVAQSDAVNYGMMTEDLIRKLQEYDEKYGIDIFHAETDTIEFRLKRLPAELPSFCEDLYKFCPDIVDQGVGSVEELQDEIEKEGIVFLWWD